MIEKVKNTSIQSINVILAISKALRESKASLFAASTAFFAFLSLIPMLILVCSILPFIHGSQEMFLSVIDSVLPRSLEAFSTHIIEEIYDKSITLLSVSAVLMLWVAGKGFYALKAGINAIRHVRESRGMVFQRMVASLYTIVFILCVVFSFVFMLFGNYLNEALIRILPTYSYVYQFMVHFRFLFAWAVMTVFLQIAFAILPNEKVSVRLQLPGAFFSSVVWSVFSWGFSIYIDKMNGFGMYGSLTTIIAIMMWLYIGFYILLMGVSINVHFEEKYQILLMERKNRRKMKKRADVT